MRLRITLLIFSLVSLFSAVASAAKPQTFLTLISEPGDYVGQGITQTLTAADGTFTVTNTPDTVSISFNSSSQFWYLDFGSATTVKFGHGEYDGAQAVGAGSPTRPTMDVYGDGRGCQNSGRFLVSDFALNSDGTVARLAIDFEQHCEGFTAALYGSIRYNSSVAAEPRLAVSNSYALKGNTGTSDALVTASLCLPSTTIVQVAYTTADASAVQGTDYVNTTGIVTFQPGITTQTISIPVMGDVLARGNKTFQVKLSAPSGAPIGASTASILIRDPNLALTALAMSSQPGDYIGGGLQYLITQSDGTFTVTNVNNWVSLYLLNGDDWTAYFQGPTVARLGRGDYENAQMFELQPPGTPGLDVYGDGRGCDSITGNFQVLQADYNSSGVLQNFSVNFEQHCQSAVAALFGWWRYHAKLQQFSVTDAVISGSSAVFTVTLNPSNATSLSVNFATADGTAVAGTDYVSTSQTVTFSPGTTEQTVTVPLLNPEATAITFYGQLSSPTGAPVWVGQGSATF
jgi:hypothetical protein